MTNRTIEDRLLDKCIPEPNTGCWIWLGAQQPSGYGQMWNGKRPEQAHRISFRLYKGDIHEGFEIDHQCNNAWCVNPAHLQAISHAENIRRSSAVMGINARKAICKRGHQLSGDNLRIDVSGNRQCRECTNLRGRSAKERKRNGSLLQRI